MVGFTLLYLAINNLPYFATSFFFYSLFLKQSNHGLASSDIHIDIATFILHLIPLNFEPYFVEIEHFSEVKEETSKKEYIC